MTVETCEVYWIHLDSHTDIFTEGYVGISVKGTQRRFIEHRSAANKGSTLTVHNAIRKHSSDIIVDTILIGTPDYCLDVESKLRPSPHIGWNISPGGALTRLGMKLSDESREKISLNNGQRGRVYTEDERLRKSIKAKELDFKHTEDMKEYLRLVALERINTDGGKQLASAIQAAREKNKSLLPWQRPNANESVWLLANEIYEAVVQNESYGQRKIARLLGLKFSEIFCIFRDVRAGWIPQKDPDWVNFKLKGK